MDAPEPGGPRRPGRFDFHSHTYLTDGESSATEMWHYAALLGHRVLAVTDHIGPEDPGPLLARLREEALAVPEGSVVPIIGVEITYVDPPHIAGVVRAARRAGAEIVIVHGETLAEQVPPGTNRAALETGEVDILAHPGLLTREEAELARAHGTILELSARRGHSFTNGRVARRAIEAGAAMVLDSDAHSTSQLVPWDAARRLALGAGLEEEQVVEVLDAAPRAFLKRLGRPI
jgi:histidinol phosphatase-like PHP family hydrolase